MKPILFNSDETEFSTNGLGRLNPVNCKVTEERNGMFELEMEVRIEDKYYPLLREGMILYASHDDTKVCQPFEIYQISRPLNGTVTVNAWHISYRLSKMTVMPFRANSCVLALSGLSDHAAEPCPFTFWTDKTNSTGVFSVDKPETIRSRLAGNEGSILDAFGGGEYEWDHFTVKLYNRRGRDTDVTFRYGKNITDLKKTTDATDVWTGICPFWAGQDEDGTEVLVTLPEKVIYSGHEDSYSYRMVIPMDFSSSFEKKPTIAQLRSRAVSYVEENAPDGIPSNIDVSFVQLWQTEEYKNLAALERLSLCDSLTIRYEKLGVSNTARIIKTVYDVLLERYESMTIGDVRTHLGDLIRKTADEVAQAAVRKVPTKTALQTAIDTATRLIQGGLGGHVVIGTDAEGKPNEILFMDTEDRETAVNVLRINMNGIGFSSSGYEGPFHSAWTLDGKFNADFISTGILNASMIQAGAFKIRNAAGDIIFLADIDNNAVYLGGESVTIGGEPLTETLSKTITATDVYYLQTNSSSIAPALDDPGWDEAIPEKEPGLYIWQKTVTHYTGGTEKTTGPVCLSGTDGEDAILLLIDSSMGNMFKNSEVSTTLSVTIFYGSRQITTTAELRETFGQSASIIWKYKGLGEDTWHTILVTDSRLRNDGFAFELSPSDVDTKITFTCELDF